MTADECSLAARIARVATAMSWATPTAMRDEYRDGDQDFDKGEASRALTVVRMRDMAEPHQCNARS